MNEEIGEFKVKIKNFTPVLDDILEEEGPLAALVFGMVWRYCQMKDGICRASIEKIASRLKMSYSTTQRYLKRLVSGGWLEDKTPNRRFKPHTYAISNKVQIRGLIEAISRPDTSVNLTDEVDKSDRHIGKFDRCTSVFLTDEVGKFDRCTSVNLTDKETYIRNKKKKQQQQETKTCVVSSSSKEKREKKKSRDDGVVVVLSSLSSKEEREAYWDLRSCRVSDKTIKELLASFPPKRISEVCTAAHNTENIKSMAGWVVRALREGWRVDAGDSFYESERDWRVIFKK